MTTASRTSRRSPVGWLTRIAVLIAVGIVAVLAVNIFTSQPRSYGPQTVSGEGITRLALDSAVGNVDVSCGPGNDFVLTQEEVRHQWEMKRDGDTVQVGHRGMAWGFGLDLFFGGKEIVTLTIPNALCQSNLEVNVKVSAGQLAMDGKFAALGVEVSAGTATLSGQSPTVTVGVSAGELNLNLDGAKTVNAEISAGTVHGVFTQVPETVKISVSAGDVSLNLPSGNYNVNSDISAGEFNNQLSHDPQGVVGHVDVDISAGSLTLT